MHSAEPGLCWCRPAKAPPWSTNDVTATSMRLATRRRKWVRKALNGLILWPGNDLTAARFPNGYSTQDMAVLRPALNELLLDNDRSDHAGFAVTGDQAGILELAGLCELPA